MTDKHSMESGQSMILIALLLVALIAAAGLVLDGGRVYAARRQSQNASDGAALAGVRALVMGHSDGEIRSAIDTYAVANLALGPEDVEAYYLDKNNLTLTTAPIGSWDTVPAAATGVSVTVAFHLDPWLMGVINSGQKVDVNTVAAAQSGPPDTVANLMPMTVRPCQDPATEPNCFDLAYGDIYQLWGDKQSGGAFQWVAYNNDNSPNTITQYLYMTLSSGPVSKGDWVPSGPGVENSSNIIGALDWWLAKPEEQRHWIIPVYDQMRGTGNNVEYHVYDFAEFIFLGYHLPGKENVLSSSICTGSLHVSYEDRWIEGCFIKWVIPGPGDPEKCNQTGLDVCSMWLSQ